MRKNVLVVDDNYDDLDFVKKILDKEGYDVTAATNGAKAMDALSSGVNFNLILIDIKMPTLSGYDLLRLIRERLNHSAKMLYISVVKKKNVDMNDVDGFIQKPVSAARLVKEVKRVIH